MDVIAKMVAARCVGAALVSMQPTAPTQGPSWVADHRIILPVDWEQQHTVLMLQSEVELHKLAWSQLRRAQVEDEMRCQSGHKKRMPWLTTARDIDRTAFSSLKVDPAIHVLRLDTADQLRLRRTGGWVG